MKIKESKKNPENSDADEDTQMFPENLSPARKKLIEDIRKSLRYEYYLHYIGVDRRTERWVTEHHVKIDQTEIDRKSRENNEEEERRKKALCD